jgi:hypothetical protein
VFSSDLIPPLTHGNFTATIARMKLNLAHLALFLLAIAVSATGLEESDEAKLGVIEERLLAAVKQDEGRCRASDWATKYSEFHKAMLASPSPKLLVAIPHLSGKSVV